MTSVNTITAIMTPPLPPPELTGGMRLELWRRAIGISRTTAWRLRKTGRLKTITRYGTVYVTAAGIKEFFQVRAAKADDQKGPRPQSLNCFAALSHRRQLLNGAPQVNQIKVRVIPLHRHAAVAGHKHPGFLRHARVGQGAIE
jgi:hypothetical protein